MTLRLGNKKVCPTKLVKVNNVDWSKIGLTSSRSFSLPTNSTSINIYNGRLWISQPNEGFFPRGSSDETYATKFVNFSQPFEIHAKITAPTYATNKPSCVFGNCYSNQYCKSPECTYTNTDANNTFWFGLSTDGQNWTYTQSFSTSEVPKSTTGEIYEVTSKYTGSEWIVSVTFRGETVTKSLTISGTPYYSQSSDASGSFFCFGNNAGGGNMSYGGGWLYLDNTYIKQNDVLVWGCEKGRNYVEVDPNNYLISNVVKVGAISDDKGVLSGFNSTNYVKLPSDVSASSANSWEVVIPFRYSQVGTENQVLLGYSTYGSDRYKSPQIYLANGGTIELCLSSNGTSWNLALSVSSTNTLVLNRDYVAKLSFDGTEYKLEISSDNGDNFATWITVQSSTKIYGFYNTSLGTGGGGSAMFPINGLIDLNGCSLKVNNQTVWEGIVPQGTRG